VILSSGHQPAGAQRQDIAMTPPIPTSCSNALTSDIYPSRLSAMSQKRPFTSEALRIQEQLRSTSLASADLPYDIRWALRVLNGEEAEPPEVLRQEVLLGLAEELIARKAIKTLDWLARLKQKNVAKAARTGLHRLRSQKIEIEIPISSFREQSGTGTLSRTAALRGLITLYDSRCQRMLWLTQEATQGILIHQARVSAEHGLLGFDSWRTGRRRYKELSERISERLPTAEVEIQTVRWFIEDAVQLSHATEHGLPEGYASASQLLGPAPDGAHPALSIEPAQVSNEILLGLLELRELQPWLPDRDFVRSWLLRIDEVATSRILVDEHQRSIQIGNTIERATADYFNAARCRTSRRILLDTAHFFGLKGRMGEAASARTAADLFELPPERLIAHPFPRAFIERSIAPRTRPPKKEEVELESGLILPGGR
jgi:hypothetical protein